MSFSYNGLSQTLISNNLVFKKNEVTAIVGKSGSGKSTLVDLIMGYYIPDSGAITIDGININKLNLSKYRQLFSLVSQDVYLFSGSLYENIIFGCKSIPSDEKISEALKKANCVEFIDNLDNGLDTQITNNACNLSGGQRQRLSIARAILADAPIVVFDEATSALDVKSESIIMRSIKEFKDKTIIIISHKFSSIKCANNIYTIDKGKIIESGKHSDLVKNNTFYKKLYNLQIKESDLITI